MALIKKIRSMMSEPEEPRYLYECASCGTVFESQIVFQSDATCPDCGSDRVYATS